jgi:hypothetical protein
MRRGVVAQRRLKGNDPRRLGLRFPGCLPALTLLACLAGCAIAPPACVLPRQTPVTVIQFFFGRDMPGGGMVSDADWADFATHTLTTEFPAGFTVSDGRGQWLDPSTRHIGKEETKIVLIAVPRDTRDLPSRLEKTIVAYRTRFHQEAVGVVSTAGCGAF